MRGRKERVTEPAIRVQTLIKEVDQSATAPAAQKRGGKPATEVAVRAQTRSKRPERGNVALKGRTRVGKQVATPEVRTQPGINEPDQPSSVRASQTGVRKPEAVRSARYAPQLPKEEIEPDDRSRSSLVNAVVRALNILDCFDQAGRPLGNQDIVSATGLPKSTVSRITRTLTERHYLHPCADTERFHLGPRILALAATFQRLNPLPTIIQPYLQDLAKRTRATVGFGVAGGLDAHYIQVARGVSAIILQVDVGSKLPLIDSAFGLALIAGASGDERERLYASLKANEKRRWPEVKRRIDAAHEQLSTLGYCTSIGTWHESINGVGVPFKIVGESTVYAVNIGGPAFFMDERTLSEVHGPALRDMIDDLKAQELVIPLF